MPLGRPDNCRDWPMIGAVMAKGGGIPNDVLDYFLPHEIFSKDRH